MIYFLYEHKSLTGPFHLLNPDAPVTIAADTPVHVTVQRATNTQQAVLNLDECAHLHIVVPPHEEVVVLTDAQVDGLRCMETVDTSRCGTPVLCDATNNWNESGASTSRRGRHNKVC